MAVLTLYGSAVADATLTSACDMATATGGVETSKTSVSTSSSGFHNFCEITSQGTAGEATVTAIPVAPTGNGWVYRPGAGTFAAGNWSASITISALSSPIGETVRFFLLAGGSIAAPTLIGTITHTGGSGAKQAYSFVATSMSAVTFGATDVLYTDLWWNDASAVGDNPTVYESTTTANGVASDMQITTSSFTPTPVTSTRTIPTSAALLQTSSRTVPATSALLATSSRSVPTSAALLATSSRSVSASAALLATSSRSVPTNAALLATSSRIITAKAALLQTSSRSVGAQAALLGTMHRTIPVTAALSGISIIKYNANVYVRSGQASALVRSGQTSLIVRE